MKQIINRIDPHLIEKELDGSKFVRNTNNIGNQIYIFDADSCPNTLLEVGRLRELTFRTAGGGTSKEIDLDEFDIGENQFKQLIVWDPEMKVIVGGYRFALGKELPLDKNGQPESPTSHLFNMSEKFINKYFCNCIELGRSFIQPDYQSTSNARKSIYALDNLWDGLGSLVIDYPKNKYFFGKITMYTHYPQKSRDTILYFLKTFFADHENLLRPHQAIPITTADEYFEKMFVGNNLEENYKILGNTVRSENVSIPPLVNAYMKLSETMKSFGTAINHEFGEVEETGILIKIADIYESKKRRHISKINREFKKQ